MKNETFLVYMHTCNINGKKYVGMTSKTLEERSKNGSGYYKNKELYADIQKYGWYNFTHEILEENLTLDEARERERYYIKEFNTQNIEFGYNTSAGGDYCKPTEEGKRKQSAALKGRQFTEEHKHKISESRKGTHLSKETRRKQSEALSGEKNPMFGKHHKEESKRKNSESNKGKHAGEKHPMFGKHHKNETRQKISESIKGRHWYNNGIIQLQAFECPPGFVSGMIKRT